MPSKVARRTELAGPEIPVPDKGLARGAISFLSNVVVGVSSAAPAYSLASALGGIAGLAAFGTPAILLVAFVPMLCVATAYYRLNRIDPDCGTTFTWVHRAMGPHFGWLGGWAVIATNILVMPSLAAISGQYTFQLFGITHPPAWAVTSAGVAWIIAVTAICYHGVELSARVRRALLGVEFAILVLFAVLALIKVRSGTALPEASHPSIAWFDPTSPEATAKFVEAALVAVFIYWGWDSGLSVNEETEDPTRAPGHAAILSTLLLVGVYVFVAVAALAFAGPALLAANSADVFAPIGHAVLGGGLDRLLILAVLTSAAGSAQTSIMPAARTALSMAVAGALPERFAHMHPVYKNPDFGTLLVGALSIAWFVALSAFSRNVLDDTVLAMGLVIAFYYGLTAFASVIFDWPRVTEAEGFAARVGAFVRYAAIPLAGGIAMAALFAASCVSLSSAGSTHLAGLSGPLVIGLGTLGLGVVAMLAVRWGRGSAAFWG